MTYKCVFIIKNILSRNWSNSLYKIFLRDLIYWTYWDDWKSVYQLSLMAPFKLRKDVLKYSKNLINWSPINKKLSDCFGALLLEAWE